MFTLNDEWKEFLSGELSKPYFLELMNFCEKEYAEHRIFPPREKVFNALNQTKPEDVKVVIMGQDPYINVNQAIGLAFSVGDNVPLPPSLVNIFKEIKDTTGIDNKCGNLEPWARQGVLLLNTTLTVRAGVSLSHAGKGWEIFTKRIVELISERFNNIVFILWGGNAKKFEDIIDKNKHLILKAAHPSPLSAYNGFFGCNHFVRTNNYLRMVGKSQIDWSTDKKDNAKAYKNLSFDL